MGSRDTTVIGFLGTNLDDPSGPDRWERWRPSVGLCGAEDFLVDRFEMLVDPKFQKVAERVAADIRQVSPETEVCIHPFAMRDPWDFGEVYELLHAFCAGYEFDRESSDYLVHMTTGTHVAQICLYLLTEANYIPGKLVQTGPPRGRTRRGRDETWLGTRQIIDLDLSKYDRLATRFAAEQAEARDFLRSGIATRNEAFNALIDEVEVVSLRSKASVLLTGPTGAGKSHLARRIYELRQSRAGLEGAFVEINCATLRGDTAMSALFGHKKGGFTGATGDRPGLLREAHNGLLFLDEIGELGLDEQAMLLRALEEGTFIPVGSDSPSKSRFQLIAGTNRDLAAAVVDGTFREDLLARINLWTFRCPRSPSGAKTSPPTSTTSCAASPIKKAAPPVSTKRRGNSFSASPKPPIPPGAATSATSTPPSPAWPPSPRADAFAARKWTPKSAASKPTGSAPIPVEARLC